MLINTETRGHLKYVILQDSQESSTELRSGVTYVEYSKGHNHC